MSAHRDPSAAPHSPVHSDTGSCEVFAQRRVVAEPHNTVGVLATNVASLGPYQHLSRAICLEVVSTEKIKQVEEAGDVQQIWWVAANPAAR